MANEMKIANGLILDFDPGAAGGTDTFLMRDTTSGLVTELSSVPASRISSGGNLTETTSSVLTITGGTGAVLSGITIQVKLAATGQSGYLSSTDWNTFNNKQSTTLTDGQFWIGASGTNIATGRAISGDITISNTGVAAIGSGVIVNADINASAAIAFSKMAALSASLVLASDGSGFITTVAGLTTTKAGYLTNITSDVQAQFTTTNQRIVNIATNAIVKTPTSTQNGYAIIWDNSAAEWTLGPVGGGGSITGAGSSTDNAISRWNGTGGTSIQDSGVIIDDSNNVTGVASLTIGTSGLHLLDTDASHDLIISVGTNITADRTLTVTTGDSDRTITFSGNPTLSDWFDQSVKAAASPSFADVTLSNAGGLHILDSDDSHDLVLRTTSNLTADRELIFVTGDATRTLTINASGTLYVTGGTDVAVADGGTGLSAIAALSILVANSANTYVALTPAAGQSIRMNAGGTAWEAYTPGGSISGLTANRIPYATSATALSDDSALTWDATNNAITVNGARFHVRSTGSVYIGPTAGNFTSTANLNTGVGDSVMDDVTTGSQNSAFGATALGGVIDGVGNSVFGANGSGGLITSGSNNSIFGRASGGNITTGSNNLVIGALLSAQSATTDNQMTIQNAIFGLGNSATGTTISTGTIGIYVTDPTASLDIAAGTTAKASLRIRKGVAPTSPNDGDIWYNDAAETLHVRIDGVTRTFTVT